MALKLLHRNIVHPTGRHTASLIFLHGAGDTGIGIQQWVKDVFDQTGDKKGFKFNHIKVIYPTAPPQPYNPTLGEMSHVWFNRVKFSYESPEIINSIRSMEKQLSDVIQEEKYSGINADRIIVGGFSMGGSMAMQLAYVQHTDLRATFALSSFLAKKSRVHRAIEEFRLKYPGNKLPPLFMAQGTYDSLSLPEWGKGTFEKLKSLGVEGQFHSFNYEHEIGSEEMVLLRDWVNKILPENVERKL